MNIWHNIPQENITSGKFSVYITMQKGSNKKYEFDTKTGCLRLVEMLYAAACYPVNGGIIPRTLNDFQHPLEVFVICQEPLDLYTLVECSPVGSIRVKQNGRVEEKIIALPILENTTGIGFVDSESTLQAVYEELRFFYNTYSGTDASEQWMNGEISGMKAIDLIEEAICNYKKQYGSDVV